METVLELANGRENRKMRFCGETRQTFEADISTAFHEG
jgi:hypothetical protein